MQTLDFFKTDGKSPVPIQWSDVSCHDRRQYFIDIFFTSVTTTPSQNPCQVIPSTQRKNSNVWRQLETKKITCKPYLHVECRSQNLKLSCYYLSIFDFLFYCFYFIKYYFLFFHLVSRYILQTILC